MMSKRPSGIVEPQSKEIYLLNRRLVFFTFLELECPKIM